MSIKEMFKKAGELFSEYKKELLAYFVILAIIFSLSLALSFLYGIWFILLIFVLFPIQFAMNMIIKKMGEHMSVAQNDIYVGYKKFLGSLSFGSKTNIKGFALGILTSFGVTFIGAFLTLVFLNILEPATYATLLETNDVNAIYQMLLEIDWVKEIFFVISLVTILATTIVFCATGLPANMAEFACFDAPLTPDGGVTVSRRAVKRNAKQFFGINLLFALFVLVAFGLGYGFYYLTNGSLFVNKYLVVLIMSMIIGVFWAIIYIFYLAVKYQYYVTYGKNEVKTIMKELKEAREQLNKLDEDVLNKGKNDKNS